MPRHTRLAAALTTAALGASLATPGIAAATTPTLPDLSGALSAAGISSSTASTILSELSSLQSLSPGGSLPLGSLSSLDNTLSTLGSGLVPGLLASVTSLLTALNPAAPTSLEQTLSDLQQVASAPGASTAVQQAATELHVALSTAGLGQLLSQLSGLSSGQDTSALGALASVQSLTPGTGVPSGSLAPVAQVLTTLASQSGVPSGAASTLNSLAGTLSGSPSAATLLSVISQLQSVSGSLPSPLNSVATALASQLQSAGSIFGGLASVGNPPSTTTVTNAITVLQALPILSPGQIIPAGALSSVATLLTTIASEPGVPAPVASTLDSVATTLSGNVDSTALSGAITQLQGVSSQLPSPLNDVVGGIITQLAQAGSLSGTTTTSTTSTSTTSTNTTTTSTTDTTSTTSNSTSSGGGGGGGGGGTGGGGGGSSGGAGGSHSGTHGGSIVVLGGQRRGDSLSLLLYCSASANRSCTATVTLTERSRRTIRRRVTMRGGRQRAITLHLRPLRRHHPRLHRQPMRLSLRSGAYKLNVRLR